MEGGSRQLRDNLSDDAKPAGLFFPFSIARPKAIHKYMPMNDVMYSARSLKKNHVYMAKTDVCLK